MPLQLRELELQEDRDLYAMAREIGPGENGFVNTLYTSGYPRFVRLLPVLRDYASGIGLPPGQPPQTLYVLYDGQWPVGYGKLRHRLTNSLRVTGGHIGYCIRPSERRKGYGSALLAEVLEQAAGIGITRALLTCNEDNLGSRRVIEKNGGRLAELENRYCRYWIDLAAEQPSSRLG